MNTTNSSFSKRQGRGDTVMSRQQRRFEARQTAKLDYRLIAKLALENAQQLLQRWLPNGRQQGVEWVSLNPTRYDKKLGSFKINLVTGRWADFATGASGGDLISLKAYLDQIPQREAANCILQDSGRGTPRSQPFPERAKSTMQVAREYWDAARHGPGSIVERYLSARALPPSVAKEFRFHPTVRHREANDWLPAMLAAVFQTGMQGLQGIHVTYLVADGSAKAGVEPNKRMFGRIKGSGVWLGAPQRTLVVAEGIETALSVRAATGLSAVAALSCTLLPHLIFPDVVREVIIASDNDEAGKRWGLVAAGKWSREGLGVRLAKLGGANE